MESRTKKQADTLFDSLFDCSAAMRRAAERERRINRRNRALAEKRARRGNR